MSDKKNPFLQWLTDKKKPFAFSSGYFIIFALRLTLASGKSFILINNYYSDIANTSHKSFRWILSDEYMLNLCRTLQCIHLFIRQAQTHKREQFNLILAAYYHQNNLSVCEVLLDDGKTLLLFSPCLLCCGSCWLKLFVPHNYSSYICILNEFSL